MELTNDRNTGRALRDDNITAKKLSKLFTFFSLQVKKSGDNPTLDNFSFGNRSEGLD